MSTKGIIQGLLPLTCCWVAYQAADSVRVITPRLQHEGYPQLSEIVSTSLPAFLALTLLQVLMRFVLRPVGRALIPRKAHWGVAVYDAKIDRFTAAVYKAGYHTLMGYWGFAVLKGVPWTPAALGGQGQIRESWEGAYPYQPIFPEVTKYYLVALGYQLSEAFTHVLYERERPDFYTMLLHHVVSTSLVGFSYALNFIRIGSLILFLHTVSDVFIYLCKAFVDTSAKKFCNLCYVFLVLSFGWLRLVVFPTQIIHSTWVDSLPKVGQHFDMGAYSTWCFFNFMLLILFFLHVYWFCLIVKTGMVMIKTGQRRDMVADLTSMDLMALEKKRR